MGFFNFFKNQFIEVIEWQDTNSNTLVYQFPVHDNEIKMGAELTVRESQVAIMVNEGEIADVFGPGRHMLYTQNMPVLTKLKSWKHGFESPFKAEVYFINTKQFVNQKWGTSNPIMMRDQDFGMIRLRGYGIYSYRVAEPVVFLRELFGTNSSYDTNAVEGHLKKMIISGLSDLFAESQVPALDLSMHYDELSEAGKQKMIPRFAEFGFTITSLYIENLSLPDEVEQAMDKRTTMGVLGNMADYQQYQAAEAIRDAAQNESGLAGAGVGMGAGISIGQTMAGAMNANQAPEQAKIICPHCQAQNPKGTKFCSQCGKAAAAETVPCIGCGEQIGKQAKFCSSCGTAQVHEKICPACSHSNLPDAKFCAECGETLTVK